jgi:dGTPase
MTSIWSERRTGWSLSEDSPRTPFDVDYSRVVHSGSFRRLQGKTQILNLGDGDFYRTRLTHSLEVAQISSGIVLRFEKNHSSRPAFPFLPSRALIQAIGLAHDLGHPPFGHGGEVALNYCMRDEGGFEGNGQTLRILSKLENFSEGDGSDLTRRCLLGVLKYPAAYSEVANPEITARIDVKPTSIRIIDRVASKPPKCYLNSEHKVVDWILAPLSDEDRRSFNSIESKEGRHSKPKHKSFDSSIMDIADDIAYGVHDLEDTIALGLIREEHFRQYVGMEDCPTFLEFLTSRHPSCDVYGLFLKHIFGTGKERKHWISRLVGHFIDSIFIDTASEFDEPLLRYQAKMPPMHRHFLDCLQKLVVDIVIKSASVQHLEFKGQTMVIAVFEALQSDPQAFLPVDAYQAFVAAEGDSRVICDYVSGMTDNFLLKTFNRLFSPRMGSVFDKL